MAPKRKASTAAAKAENGDSVAVPKKRGRPPRAKASAPAPVAAPNSLAPVAAPGPPEASPKKRPAKKAAIKGKAASSKKKAGVVKQISTEDEDDKENGGEERLREVPPTVDEAGSGNHSKAARIKSVTIEHCKSDTLFKKSAQKLEEALKAAGVNLEIIMNPEKPRKGSFEVQDDEGNKYVSLQNLSKPYMKLKAVDLEAIAAAIASKAGVVQVS